MRGGRSLALFKIFAGGLLFFFHGLIGFSQNVDRQTIDAVFEAIQANDTNALAAIHATHTNCLDDAYYKGGYSRHYPLLQAAVDGRTAIVGLLLEYGADPNAAGDTRTSVNVQMTALEEAARSGYLKICEMLLKAGANPNHQSFSGDTALHEVFSNVSVSSNRDELGGLLLNYGANPFLEAGYYKNTPIELDITRANGKLVARMLGQDKTRPLANKSEQKASTPRAQGVGFKTVEKFLAEQGTALLTAAARRGELEAVQALIQAGVPVRPASGQDEPIMRAFAMGAAEAAKTRPATVQQFQEIRRTIEAWRPDMVPETLIQLRSQESWHAERLEAMDPERWRQVLALLTNNGAEYDAFAATALGDLERARHLLSEDQEVVSQRDHQGRTLLHWSVQNDQLPLTTFWIESGVSPAVTNSAGQTALHLAAAQGLLEHIKLLLAVRAPMDIRDTNGWTPMDMAIQAKQQEAVRFLLSEKGAPPRPERAIGTALHEAAANGSLAALSALTESATNLEARNELGLTVLQVAFMHGHLSAAALLLDKGANINARDPNGNNLLQQTILDSFHFTIRDRPPTNWYGRIQGKPDKEVYLRYLMLNEDQRTPNPILQGAAFLLMWGLDAAATNSAGQTAFAMATDEKLSQQLVFFEEDERAAFFRLLARGGGDANEADSNGETALHRNARGYNSIFGSKITELVESGADVNATNRQCRTALHVAVQNVSSWPGEGGADNALLALIKAKANVNAQDIDGLTPLHLLATATQTFRRETAKALLDAGADPNVRDKQGRTPVHLAISGKWPWGSAGEYLQMVAKAGADLSAKDNKGRTPLHYLAALGRERPLFFIHGVRELLQGRDLNTQDNNGHTPLHIAGESSTSDVFDWLVKQGASLKVANNAGEKPRLGGQPGNSN